MEYDNNGGQRYISIKGNEKQYNVIKNLWYFYIDGDDCCNQWDSIVYMHIGCQKFKCHWCQSIWLMRIYPIWLK